MLPSSRLLSLLVCASAALFLASCASAPRALPNSIPRAIELREEPQISTFHFPPGIYLLGDQDETGFYSAHRAT